jgi:site-specific recombinase XerD
VHQQKVMINTGLAVKPSQFDKRKGRVRLQNQKAVDYNLMIDQLMHRVHELRVKSRLGQIKLQANTLRDLVLNYSINTDFLAYMEWKIDQRKRELEHGTRKHHRSVYKIFKEYCGSLPFSNIDNKILFDFKAHLKRRGNNINTVGAKVKVLKTYLNHARQDGFVFTWPERGLKYARNRGEIQALTSEELKRAIQLYQKHYLEDHRQQVLRCFLFSCFTGLRYSDIQTLRPENIIGEYIVLVPKKTQKQNKMIKIPLQPWAKNLLDLNSEFPLGRVISNQKMNASLKVIARFIQTPIKLSYHVSRHTFATTFLELGGSLEVLREIMGHSNISQTMIYAHVIDQRKNQQMQNFGKLFD